jgi:hypothetical protein
MAAHGFDRPVKLDPLVRPAGLHKQRRRELWHVITLSRTEVAILSSTENLLQ